VNALVARAAPPGSTIGVVTPGSPPETRAEVERGVAWWESKGYRVKLMPGALEQDGWHAGSPEVRAADLQTAFADPEIDAIQTMRGGYGSAQVIPLLDFDAIAETPKFFVGLSDITALHAALLARAGLATFYGPSLTMFGNPSLSPFTAERFLQVLAGETTGPVPEDRDRLTVIAIAGGGASGRLVGGCLGDFIYTIGTPWEPDLKGRSSSSSRPTELRFQLTGRCSTWSRSASSRACAASSSANSPAVSGTSTRPRRDQKRWRRCSRTALAGSVSRCSTVCPWGTERASPRFRSASKRQSTQTR
jgi:LD-carboxypeptidase N-terminal domain